MMLSSTGQRKSKESRTRLPIRIGRNVCRSNWREDEDFQPGMGKNRNPHRNPEG
jgi:hypothetical protein